MEPSSNYLKVDTQPILLINHVDSAETNETSKSFKEYLISNREKLKRQFQQVIHSGEILFTESGHVNDRSQINSITLKRHLFTSLYELLNGIVKEKIAKSSFEIIFDNNLNSFFKSQPHLKPDLYFIGGFTIFIIDKFIETLLQELDIDFEYEKTSFHTYADIDVLMKYQKLTNEGVEFYCWLCSQLNYIPQKYDIHLNSKADPFIVNNLRQYLKKIQKNDFKNINQTDEESQYLHLMQKGQIHEFDISSSFNTDINFIFTIDAIRLSIPLNDSSEICLISEKVNIIQVLHDVATRTLRIPNSKSMNAKAFWKTLLYLSKGFTFYDFESLKDIANIAYAKLIEYGNLVDSALYMIREITSKHAPANNLHFRYVLLFHLYAINIHTKQLLEHNLQEIKFRLDQDDKLSTKSVINTLIQWPKEHSIKNYFSLFYLGCLIGSLLPRHTAKVSLVKHCGEWHFQVFDQEYYLYPYQEEFVINEIKDILLENGNTIACDTLLSIIDTLAPLESLQSFPDEIEIPYSKALVAFGETLLQSPNFSIQLVGYKILLRLYLILPSTVPNSDFIEITPQLLAQLPKLEKNIVVTTLSKIFSIPKWSLKILKSAPYEIIRFGWLLIIKDWKAYFSSQKKFEQAITSWFDTIAQFLDFNQRYNRLYKAEFHWNYLQKKGNLTLTQSIHLYQIIKDKSILENFLAKEILENLEEFEIFFSDTIFETIIHMASKDLSKTLEFWKKAKTSNYNLQDTVLYKETLKTLQKQLYTCYERKFLEEDYDFVYQDIVNDSFEIWSQIEEYESFSKVLGHLFDWYLIYPQTELRTKKLKENIIYEKTINIPPYEIEDFSFYIKQYGALSALNALSLYFDKNKNVNMKILEKALITTLSKCHNVNEHFLLTAKIGLNLLLAISKEKKIFPSFALSSKKIIHDFVLSVSHSYFHSPLVDIVTAYGDEYQKFEITTVYLKKIFSLCKVEDHSHQNFDTSENFLYKMVSKFGVLLDPKYLTEMLGQLSLSKQKNILEKTFSLIKSLPLSQKTQEELLNQIFFSFANIVSPELLLEKYLSLDLSLQKNLLEILHRIYNSYLTPANFYKKILNEPALFILYLKNYYTTLIQELKNNKESQTLLELLSFIKSYALSDKEINEITQSIYLALLDLVTPTLLLELFTKSEIKLEIANEYLLKLRERFTNLKDFYTLLQSNETLFTHFLKNCTTQVFIDSIDLKNETLLIKLYPYLKTDQLEKDLTLLAQLINSGQNSDQLRTFLDKEIESITSHCKKLKLFVEWQTLASLTTVPSLILKSFFRKMMEEIVTKNLITAKFYSIIHKALEIKWEKFLQFFSKDFFTKITVKYEEFFIENNQETLELMAKLYDLCLEKDISFENKPVLNFLKKGNLEKAIFYLFKAYEKKILSLTATQQLIKQIFTQINSSNPFLELLRTHLKNNPSLIDKEIKIQLHNFIMEALRSQNLAIALSFITTFKVYSLDLIETILQTLRNCKREQLFQIAQDIFHFQLFKKEGYLNYLSQILLSIDVKEDILTFVKMVIPNLSLIIKSEKESVLSFFTSFVRIVSSLKIQTNKELLKTEEYEIICDSYNELENKYTLNTELNFWFTHFNLQQTIELMETQRDFIEFYTYYHKFFSIYYQEKYVTTESVDPTAFNEIIEKFLIKTFANNPHLIVTAGNELVEFVQLLNSDSIKKIIPHLLPLQINKTLFESIHKKICAYVEKNISDISAKEIKKLNLFYKANLCFVDDISFMTKTLQVLYPQAANDIVDTHYLTKFVTSDQVENTQSVKASTICAIKEIGKKYTKNNTSFFKEFFTQITLVYPEINLVPLCNLVKERLKSFTNTLENEKSNQDLTFNFSIPFNDVKIEEQKIVPFLENILEGFLAMDLNGKDMPIEIVLYFYMYLDLLIQVSNDVEKIFTLLILSTLKYSHSDSSFPNYNANFAKKISVNLINKFGNKKLNLKNEDKFLLPTFIYNYFEILKANNKKLTYPKFLNKLSSTIVSALNVHSLTQWMFFFDNIRDSHLRNLQDADLLKVFIPAFERLLQFSINQSSISNETINKIFQTVTHLSLTTTVSNQIKFTKLFEYTFNVFERCFLTHSQVSLLNLVILMKSPYFRILLTSGYAVNEEIFVKIYNILNKVKSYYFKTESIDFVNQLGISNILKNLLFAFKNANAYHHSDFQEFHGKLITEIEEWDEFEIKYLNKKRSQFYVKDY
ncbi:MAG: hypothetical protein BGO10_09755 [Chlamydia sp. 32-24]|nr:MAG: hypothetical protein BGO10_09755 [Chlamydia sp. 32-24]